MAKNVLMSHDKDENQALKPQDLVFVLAIAGRIDAQSRILAEKIDQNRAIYYAYAALDSANTSYSMFKYVFDVFFASKDANAMHDLMLTPGGLIGVALESIFMVSFAVLACHFDGEENGTLKKNIADAWPYFRTVMKGLKNAYKGWRSAVIALSLISNVDIKFLIAPIGIILGVLSAVNRALLLQMVEKRKAGMTHNIKLLMQFKAPGLRTATVSQIEAVKIHYQSQRSRYLSYLGVAAGGLIDGLYLYVGVLSLAILSPQILTAMAIICAIYTIACITTRIYEEYDFQLRLFVTQTKCKLAMLTRELQTVHADLWALNKNADKSLGECFELKALEKQLCDLIERFDAERKLLHQQTTRSYLSAFLLGIKNGLYAYGALASILFLVGTILLMGGIVFPPALLISCVIIGLVFMLGFVTHSMIANYRHLNKEQTLSYDTYDELLKVREILQSIDNEGYALSDDKFYQSLKEGLTMDPTPPTFFQEWFEVIRSLFSGVGKGQKFVDFAGNSLQEMDDNGIYQDTPIMFVLGGLSALLFGFTFAVRALAKGFGRPPLAQGDILPIQQEPKCASAKKEVLSPTGDLGELIQPDSPRIDSPSTPPSSPGKAGFFSHSASAMKHSPSEEDLTQHPPTEEHTIVGLT